MVPEDIRAFIDETAEKIASGEIEVETALYMTAEEVEEIREAVSSVIPYTEATTTGRLSVLTKGGFLMKICRRTRKRVMACGG